jgi:hypothetical protein
VAMAGCQPKGCFECHVVQVSPLPWLLTVPSIKEISKMPIESPVAGRVDKAFCVHYLGGLTCKIMSTALT